MINGYNYLISIPHGTIKRGIYKSERELLKPISIPHGTIKSAAAISAAGALASFQYLMVQLKGSASTAMPSSTAFQYLMVQLKVYKTLDYWHLTDISIPHGTIKRFKKERRILPDY